MSDKINKRINELQTIANEYQVKVTFNANKTEDKNSGGSSGNEIWLGKFDDVDLLTIAFFHELAHCLSNNILQHRKYCSSILANEGFAWEYGFELASQHGFTWNIEHKVYKYAEQSLRSYIYQEKINQTNEEWFNLLDTEDKARAISDMTAQGYWEEELVYKWLKEKT